MAVQYCTCTCASCACKLLHDDVAIVNEVCYNSTYALCKARENAVENLFSGLLSFSPRKEITNTPVAASRCKSISPAVQPSSMRWCAAISLSLSLSNYFEELSICQFPLRRKLLRPRDRSTIGSSGERAVFIIHRMRLLFVLQLAVWGTEASLVGECVRPWGLLVQHNNAGYSCILECKVHGSIFVKYVAAARKTVKPNTQQLDIGSTLPQ